MPLFGAKKEPERQPASAGIRKPSGVTSGQTQQMIRERGTKQGASSSQPGGISWKDYNRYEQDYNGWKTTGQHGADFGSWATDSGLQSWKSIRDRAKTGAQAALIGDTYHVLDKDTYDRYEKDYSYWKKTGKHTKDFDSWADQGQLDTWRTIRDYNIGVKAGKNPSMELQSTINGLDPEVLRQVQETYRSSWKYGTTDEDLARKAQGLPPKSKDKYYKRGTEFDSWLYSQGLPSTQGDYFQQLYDAAAQDIAARRQAQAASGTQQAPAVRGQDLSAEQAKAIAEAWRGDWSYASSTEDKARKRGGRMPKSVEAMYTDSEADQWNKANGLPPAALLPDYMGVQAGNASPEAAAVSGTGKKAKGAETAAPTEHIDFTEREQLQEEIARLFKGDWSYADTPEDKARKRAGRPPKKVEDAYTDTAADRWYKKNGLPPASMIDAYMPTQGDMAAMVSDPMRAIREAGTRPSAMPTQEDLLDAVTGGEAPAAETAAEAAPEKTQAERYAENARDRGVRREILERQGVPEDVLDAVYGPEEKPAADRAGAAAPDEIDAVTGASEYGERSAGEAPAEEAGEAAGPGKWGDLIGERYVPGREPMRAEAGEEGEVSDLLDREPGSAERTAIGTAEPGGPERAALGRNVGPTVRKAQAGPVRMAQKKEDTQLLMFLEGQKDAGVSRDEIEAYDTDGMFGQDLLDAVFGEEPAAPQGAPDPYAARPYSVDEEWWNALVDEAVSERDSGHDRQWVEDSDQWNDPTSQAVLDAVFGQKSAEQVDYEREAAKARQEAIEQEKEERRARMADASAWAEEDAAIMQANLEATYASDMGIDPSLYGTPEELAKRNLDPNAPSTAPDFLYSADGLPASQLDERIGYIDKYLAKIYEETPRTPWEVLHGLSEGEAGATIADLEAQQAKLQAMAATARAKESVEESAKLYAAVSQRPDWQEGSAEIPYEEIGSFARTRDERNILKVFDGISPWEEGRDAREQELDEYGPRVDGKYASVYYMSDGERGVFRYLARTQSMDAAMEYVDRLLPALNARSYEETAEIAAYAAEHHPILTTLWNVTGGQLISAGEGIVTGISALANDMTDGAVGTQLVENDPRLRATAAKQMMQAKIRSQIVETSGSETWGMVYDLAASIAENGVRAVLFGGAPGGQIMSATTMYGQVFASTVYEYMNEKHADYKTAIFAGLLDAGAEALGEAIDFGAFLSMKSELNAGKATGRMIAQYMLKNILTEGGSEAITSVTEKAIDYLLMQDDSEMAKLWQETYEKTGDRTEAWKAVLGTAGKDALIEGVSGAISGLFLSGGNVVFNRMRYGSGAGRATMIAGLTEGTDVNTDAAIAGDYIERAIRKGGANMSADERMAMLHEIRGMDTLTEAQKSHYMDMLESFGSLPQSMTSEETKGAIADVKEATAQASMTKAEIRAKAASRSARKQGQLQTKMDRVQAAAAEMRAAQDPVAITEAAAKVQQETAAYQTAFDQAQAEEQAAQQEDALAVERAQGPVQQKLARLESMADKEAGHFDEQLDQAVAEQAGAALEQQIGPYAAEDLRKQFNVWANDENHWINSLPTSEYNAILREVENYFEAVSNGQDAYSSERLAEVMEAARNETSYDEYAAENAYAPEASAAAEEQGIGRTGEERLEIEGDRAVIEREYQQERDALEVRQDEAEMSGDEQAVREIESEIRELDEQHAQLIEKMDAASEQQNGGTYGTEEAGAEVLGARNTGEDRGGVGSEARTADESRDQGYGPEDQGAAFEEGAEEVRPQAPFTEEQTGDIRSMAEDLAARGRAIAQDAIIPARAVTQTMQAALDTLANITGVGRTVVYDSADANVPGGFTLNGRTYARNGQDLVYNAAHEHAHNMPAVIGGIRSAMDGGKVDRSVFDAYRQARRDTGAVELDYDGTMEEFAADVAGAVLSESVTGDAYYQHAMKDRLGMTDAEYLALQDAVYEAMAYDPETEMSDEDALDAALGGEQRQEGVRYSGNVAGRDSEYRAAVEAGDMETAQKLVDEAAEAAGYTIKAHHGTNRGDRVGRVFREDRATSGPMAYFTSDRTIAENYATGKKDTSIDYDEEYGDYFSQFRVKDKNGKSVPVGDLWKTLTFAERRRIEEAAKHITTDDAGEQIIYDPSARNGNGGLDAYRIREHGGNVINALIDVWLQDGNLFGEEQKFLDILRMAGIEGATWNDPNANHEKVYDVYLRIQDPFITKTMYTDEFLDGLESWWSEQDQSRYRQESRDSMNMFDKRNMTVEEWIRKARKDVQEGTTLAWTVIPDGVTDYLKSLGHDGIFDVGGKFYGDEHEVYIPFTSTQVKSADPVTYHLDGTPVDLSERFNRGERDINYSGNVFGREDGQGDLLDAALPVYDVTPNGRSAEQESGTAAAAERTGWIAEEQGRLLDAVLPQKTEAQKRSERRVRDRENRKRRQQEKAQREREAAEKRRIEQGLFAPDASMDAMDARTQRVRMTDQAGMTAKELTDLIDNLTGQFETPTEKTPNPKDVGRVARRILKNESGATMDELELTRRLTELTSAYRNNPDRSAADSDLFDAASKLATDVVDSMEVTLADAVGEEAHYQRLIDHLRETPIKVGPRGRQQLKDAFGNLREFRAAVGNDSILDIRWVDDDKQSTYEDLGGTINGYLDEEVRQQIEEAFGDTNTIDIVDLAEFVQADRLGEHEPMHSFRDVYGQDVYDEEAANLLAEIIHAVTKTGIIGNQATYAQRGARAMADVGRDLGRIRELAQQQLENIRGIRDAGNEEARIATTSAARARQMWQEGYRQNQRENAQLAERNARLNEENERLARSETALEARRDYDRQERSLLRQSLTDEQTENRQLLKENERLGARERRRKDVLRQAEELFRAGKSARDYYEETRSDPDSYDHEVARQLNGMRLRNGQDVGGRINTQAFQSILDRSNKFAEHGSLKLTFESPVRVFEEVAGKYSRKNSNRENARVYRDRKLMGDTYVEYGNAMMSERESYIAENRERIRKAWEGHGKTTAFDSAAVQLLGEKICDETQIRDALQDGRTMVVNGIDGTFVFEKKGNVMRLRAFSDAKTTYVYPKGSTKPVGIDGALTVNRRGSGVRVTDGNGTVVADIRNGRGLNTEAVTATRDALRSYYDAALQEQNRVLVENGYAPINRVKEYFPHLGRQESGIRGFMQQLRADNLPTGINGLTATFTPGHPWAAHMQQRLGERTEFDAIRGFNSYVEAAGDQIYKTPVVQRLRQLENGLRRNAGRSDTTNAAFVAWLKEYTNQFANKKASLDRDMEDLAGRNTYSLSRFLTGAFSTAAVGGNVSSSLSNLVSWLTGAAHLNPGRVGSAAVRTISQNMARIVRGEDRYDGFAAKIPYLNRAFNGSDRIAVTRMDRIKTAGGKALYALFSAVDRFSKESIGRAVYDDCMAKGMSEQEAIRRTDDFLIKNFADRGTGQAARVFGIKWLKPFAQFQLEVLNQQYQFRDIKNEEFERKIEKAMKDVQASDPDAVDWDALGRKISVHGPREALKKAAYLALLSLWGMLTRELMGRDQSWNVVGTGKDIARAVGKIDPEERNALNVGKAVGTELLNAVTDNAPFISMITGGGRVPVLGGITNLLSYGKNALFGKDLDPLDRALYGVRAVANFVPGGGQLSKTIRGAAAVSRGGQYNAKGTRLQFPVAQTPGNWARGLAFGPSAMQPEGYDFEKDVLPEKKTEAFKEATSPDYGMDPEAAYTILHGYGGSTNAAKSASLAAGIIESGVEDLGGTFDFFSELMGYKRGMKRNGLDLPAFVREDVEARKAALPAKVESGEKTQEEADAEIRELDRFLERIMAG